ncbi:SMP-30/gluconolactonase/LRE family protein [Aquamicrobium terrae]|uniref:Sugar lactone lactonase YvrE n=1 Tax=Aquamicrobium terrae TaxID=1324945 RepID=A0ABV2N4V4_9HYPH
MSQLLQPENLARLDAPSCKLGEGPTYDPRTDTAWWFDIIGRKLLEHRFRDSRTLVHDLPFMASALARIDDRRQLLFAENGLYIRTVADGALHPHLAIEADNALTRCNDARVHQSGAFWLGTMGRDAQRGAGSIYHYRAGRLTRLYEGITISNGICFAPDAATAYYADTALGTVMKVAVDPQTGLPTGEASPFLSSFPEGAGPDGAVCDAQGKVWIALWGTGCVKGYSSEGEFLSSFSLPASQVSCPAFIGPQARVMLVTSANDGLDDTSEADQSGATFTFDLPFAGRFEPDVVL